jgi:hypothetical protein
MLIRKLEKNKNFLRNGFSGRKTAAKNEKNLKKLANSRCWILDSGFSLCFSCLFAAISLTEEI